MLLPPQVHMVFPDGKIEDPEGCSTFISKMLDDLRAMQERMRAYGTCTEGQELVVRCNRTIAARYYRAGVKASYLLDGTGSPWTPDMP